MTFMIVFKFFCQIPDQTSSVPVQHVAIDQHGKFLAAVNNKGDCYIWSLDGKLMCIFYSIMICFYKWSLI